MSIVEIISKEMVKPFSPTPHHLKIHKLSFLDQMAPSVYAPRIFFYQNHEKSDHAQKSQLLKKSLSEILTRFPPLGGTLNQEKWIVDCNDVGAEFIEAEVHRTHLTQLIQDPQMDTIKQLLPRQPLQTPGTENPILSVQITSFDCGGTTVAVCLSHKIADGTSLVDFINAWAAMSMLMSRRQVITDQFPPYNNLYFSVNNFRPMDLSSLNFNSDNGVYNDKMITKTLVFDKEKLAKLKQLAADRSEVKNPSRVEALSAFIWRHFIEAATETKTLFMATHMVNLRPRANFPIPNQALGNCWIPTFAYLSKAEESRDLVSKLRTSIRSIDEEFIKKMQNGEYMNSFSKIIVDLSKCDIETCNFSSWCRFPMYDVDFGWGKPDWVTTATLPFKNLVILMSTPSGDGIEALVNVPEHQLEMLQTHYNSLT